MVPRTAPPGPRWVRASTARPRTRSLRVAIAFLASVASSFSATSALGLGIRPGSEIAIPNADFEQGLATWSQATGAGGPERITADTSPSGPGTSARFDLLGGETAWAWNTATTGTAIPVPEPTELGWRLEGRSRIFVPASSSWGPGDEVWIEVASVEGTVNTTISRSPGLALADAPRDRWIELCTDDGFGGISGRILPGATGVTLSIWARGSGTLYVDDLRCGRYEATRFDPDNADFDVPGLQGWDVRTGAGKDVDGLDPADTSYRGQGHALLSGPAGTVFETRIPQAPAGHGPRGGSKLAAGVWVLPRTPGVGLVSASAGSTRPTRPTAAPATYSSRSRNALGKTRGSLLPPRPLAQGSVASDFVLQLVARPSLHPDDPEIVIAEGSWNPSAADLGRWHWIETEASTAPLLPFGWSHLTLRLHARSEFEFAVDGAQVGEPLGVDGVPSRHAVCDYVARFRSPHYLGGGTPISAGEAWRAWRGIQAPLCDPGNPAWNHDPACSTAPANCLRSNGRRDLAIGTTGGIDELPLIGGYDSRDPHVVALHLGWLEAAGFDAIAFESLGHTLAEERRAAGLVALNEDALDVVFDLLDRPEHDLKLLLHYEPKVHFNGWIQGEASFADRIEGLTADLVHYVEQRGPRRGALRRNGNLVVFVFGPGQCIDIGGQSFCLTDAWWKVILDDVRALTGESLLLVGDHVPANLDFVQGPPWYAEAFGGMLHWELAPLSLLRHRTFQDAVSGTPTWPSPTPLEFAQHVNFVQRGPEQWRRRFDGHRLSIGVVWPGFDDSGVAGWGAGNGLGEDGTPLCIRIAEGYSGGFLSNGFDRLEAADLDAWMVTTWNDWNERTQIEPRWNSGYVQAVLAGGTPSPASVSSAFDRLLEVQARVHGWKGSAADPQRLDDLARDYLLDAQGLPGVSLYQ